MVEKITSSSDILNLGLDLSKKNLVITKATLLSPVPKPIHISPLNNLSVGDPFDPESVINEIILNGYTREDFVSLPGHYALRGSVMDIFLTSGTEPIRIEFFNMNSH